MFAGNVRINTSSAMLRKNQITLAQYVRSSYLALNESVSAGRIIIVVYMQYQQMPLISSYALATVIFLRGQDGPKQNPLK